VSTTFGELGGSGDEGTRAEAPAQALPCSDLEFAKRLATVLSKSEIPALAGEGSGGRAVVLVPTQYARYAQQMLGALPGVVIERAEIPYYRPHDPARDQVLFDHDVLRGGLDRARERGESALDDLVQCVTHGTPSVSERAVILLGRLGAPARSTVDALAVGAIRAANAPLLGNLLRNANAAEGRGTTVPESLTPLRALAKDEKPEIRQLAVRMLGSLRATDAIPILADALLDESPDVAIEADDAFLEWGAEDVDFDPEMDLEQRREIAEARKHFTL